MDSIRLSDKEFEVLMSYLRSNFGINLEKKRTLIEGRMHNYLIQKGFSDFGSYLEYLFNDKSGNEINSVLNLLTTNYSYFMREWDQFEYYRTTILPEWRAKIKNRDLRVWSAGCSTGQEPYTLAILNMEFFAKEQEAWDKTVLATDISEKVLNQARAGVYDAESMEKMPPTWKLNYFDKIDAGRFQVKPALKKEVIYRKFNLMETHFPFKRPFHVIFCRNVMIYFDNETKRNLINRFYEATAPGGYLIVSQSETVDRSGTQYGYVMPSIYRKAGG